MRKSIQLFFALNLLLMVASSAYADLVKGGIYAENRSYSSFFTNNTDYFSMRGGAMSDDNTLPVYAQNLPHSLGSIQAEIPYRENLDLLSPPLYSYSKKFSETNGYNPPGASWEEKVFSIYLDENDNGSLDSGEAVLDWTIPSGKITQLAIPEVTITGDCNPEIFWNEIAGAERYQVRFWTVNDQNQLDTLVYKINISDDGSPSYSYIYDGGLFNQYGILAVAVMADDIDSGFYNRSTYITTSRCSEGLPWLILLLGD